MAQTSNAARVLASLTQLSLIPAAQAVRGAGAGGVKSGARLEAAFGTCATNDCNIGWTHMFKAYQQQWYAIRSAAHMQVQALVQRQTAVCVQPAVSQVYQQAAAQLSPGQQAMHGLLGFPGLGFPCPIWDTAHACCCQDTSACPAEGPTAAVRCNAFRLLPFCFVCTQRSLIPFLALQLQRSKRGGDFLFMHTHRHTHTHYNISPTPNTHYTFKFKCLERDPSKPHLALVR
jgi:hypothetical protein